MRIPASTLVVSLLAFNPSSAAAQSTADPTGHWEGTITAPMGELEFEVVSDPPAGRQRWTLRLLADKLVELDLVASISRERVRQALKKTR